MNEKETNNGIAIAALKLSMIQPAFNGTFPDMSKKDYYIRIAAKPLKLPGGREARYSPGTYACWESDCRKGDLMHSSQRKGQTGGTAGNWIPMQSLRYMSCMKDTLSYQRPASGTG